MRERVVFKSETRKRGSGEKVFKSERKKRCSGVRGRKVLKYEKEKGIQESERARFSRVREKRIFRTGKCIQE